MTEEMTLRQKGRVMVFVFGIRGFALKPAARPVD